MKRFCLVFKFTWRGTELTLMKSANDFNWISLLTAVLFTFLFAEVLGMPQYYRESNRLCETPEETFFNGKCLAIRSTEHCPSNMELFNGSDNKGFCDCVDIETRPAFYSYKTSECSFHNTQGPCLDGEWFVLKNGFPQCESIPEGCPADGHHFYGSPYETMAEQCWELGAQGPCRPDETVQVEEGPEELKISCKRPKIVWSGIRQYGTSSIGFQKPCRPGTVRNRHGDCTRGFHI